MGPTGGQGFGLGCDGDCCLVLEPRFLDHDSESIDTIFAQERQQLSEQQLREVGSERAVTTSHSLGSHLQSFPAANRPDLTFWLPPVWVPILSGPKLQEPVQLQPLRKPVHPLWFDCGACSWAEQRLGKAFLDHGSLFGLVEKTIRTMDTHVKTAWLT